MSVITRLSRLFSKKESPHILGISLHQQSVSFCFLPESEKFIADAPIASTECSVELSAEQKQNNEVSSPAAGEKSSSLTSASVFSNQAIKSSTYSQTISKLKEEFQLQGKCYLVLSAHLCQIVQVDRPKVPVAEINGALKWQIKDLVSISPDNMVLDYFDAPSLNVGQDKINVVCAPLNELKDIVGVINDDDLKVARITTEEFAFSGLIKPKNDACLVVCAQPNEEALIIIVKNGQLFFHRRLRGFAQIAEKSTQELDMGAIDSLSLEIQRSTDYFERQLKQAPIKEILVLIPMENEAYLARRLAENTNVAVNLLTLPEQFREQRKFACALGVTMLENQEPSHEQ